MEHCQNPSDAVLVPAVPRHKRIVRVAAITDPDESRRISDDGEYMKRVFTEAGDWVGEYDGWGITLKRGAYTERDLMIIRNGSGPALEHGVEELEESDFQSLVRLCAFFQKKLNEAYEGDGARFVIGVNRGPTQSLKRVHAHVTDFSLAAPINGVPIEEKKRLVSKVAVTRAMIDAIAELKDRLNGEEDYNVGKDIFPCRVSLDGQLLKGIESIRDIVETAEATRNSLNEELKDGERLWSYSMTFNGRERHPVMSVGFSHNGFGIAEMEGVALERVDGLYDGRLLKMRRDLKEQAGIILNEFKEKRS